MKIFDQLRSALPFSDKELASLIATAPYRYKVYQIPKRRAGQFRTIAQPSVDVKLVQRWLMENYLADLPIHRNATAYRKGLSIADHAALHAGRRFLLKMDFADFFPSILSTDIRRFLADATSLHSEDIDLICRLVSWKNKPLDTFCLSIGAPSSPMLSNAIMYEFDKRITALARERRVKYSRYADDLALSTDKRNVLADFIPVVQQLCAELRYPHLTINETKTVSVSRAVQRTLTGLVLTPDGSVSLGRERKRRLRSELYRFSIGILGDVHVPKLRGELAFAWSAEPDFVVSLVRQLGTETFSRLGLPFGLPGYR